MEEIPKRKKDVEINKNVTFSDMMLSKPVLAGLASCNFNVPSPIQLRAIPIGRYGSDLIIKAKSGTGKTLVFCTIILERYNAKVNAPQSLIVAPTREIALQVQHYLESVGAKCPGFKAACVIGGRDIVEDRKAINKCKSIVGTPGRILHLIKNNHIFMQHIDLLVLDEADKLFTVDFRKDINILLKALKKNRQTVASSATYADGLDQLIVSYMQNPTAVSTTHELPMLAGVRQFVYSIESEPNINTEQLSAPAIQKMLHKVKAIDNIFSHLTFKQCVLFSNSQMRAESFTNYLTAKSWAVDLIVGSQDQNVRTSTLDKFRRYKSRILITSDLMARGVDIDSINLVINLDVPSDSSTYLHRIGRCGRFGTKGIAITLVDDEEDMLKLRKLLGQIDGSRAKVEKISSTTKLINSDLWDDSLNSYEYVHGIGGDDLNNAEDATDDSEHDFPNLLNGLSKYTKNIRTLEKNGNPSEKGSGGVIENLSELLISKETFESNDDPFSSFENFKVEKVPSAKMKEHKHETENMSSSIESKNMEILEIAKLLVDMNENDPSKLEFDIFHKYSSKVHDDVSYEKSTQVIKDDMEILTNGFNYNGNQKEAENELQEAEDDEKLNVEPDLEKESTAYEEVVESEVESANEQNTGNDGSSSNLSTFLIQVNSDKSPNRPIKNRNRNANHYKPKSNSKYKSDEIHQLSHQLQSSNTANHRWAQLYNQQLSQIREYVSNSIHH